MHYPQNPYEYYKPIYYEALNSIVNAIKDRFDQPTFKLFTQAEQLFLKSVAKQDVRDKLKVLVSLTSEYHLLPEIFEWEPINLEEIFKAFALLSLALS